MKKFYTLILAAFTAAAALAQSHPANNHFLPRLNPTAELPARHAAPLKAEGQVLPITIADPVTLYTNPAYSSEGHYDYYFSFANSDDEFYFPMVFFDLYLPTPDGLEEGTYTMSGGTVDPNLMLMANYNDYVYYYYGYAAYEWTDATISLTKAEGDDMWTVDFSATSTDGYTYTFHFTGELPVEVDDYDPDDQEPEPEVEYTYDYEPLDPIKADIVFEAPDTYDGYVESNGIFDIYLDSKQKDANGRNYEARLYLLTSETKPKADFYPVNASEAENTFLASKGCPAGSSNDQPCYFRTYDETYVYDSWYIVAGHITVSYDAEGKMALEGDVASRYGSEFHFTTANLNAEGINSVLAESQDPRSSKYIRNGQVYIEGGHFLYNVKGQSLK